MFKTWGIISALTIAAGALFGGTAFSQTPPGPPVFSQAQVTRGQTAYQDRCSGCHGVHLDDGEGDGAPALVGPAFASRWAGKGVDELFVSISTQMPPDGAGTLPAEEYADLTAFILSQNNISPSQTDLPSDPQKLNAMAIPVSQ